MRQAMDKWGEWGKEEARGRGRKKEVLGVRRV